MGKPKPIMPVGIFELAVYEIPDVEGEYAISIAMPHEISKAFNIWVEAVACFASYTARHTHLGYEKTLETIMNRAIVYRDKPPNIQMAPDGDENPPTLDPPNLTSDQ